MADIKSSSRSASKTNLNEAAIPLLDEEAKSDKVETTEKDAIELKEKSETEKDDSHPEKSETSEAEDPKKLKEKEKKEKEEKKKKEKEEKKKKDEEKKKEKEEKKKEADEKKKKEKEEKRAKCQQRTEKVMQNLTVGLNLLDRDEKHVNDAVNLNFEDVLAEPDAAHGFDPMWRATYVLFTGTRFWVYRILAALFAVPLALVWGVVFSLLTFVSVWLATPLLRILEVALFYVRRVWSALVHTTLEPIAVGASALLANIRVTHNTATTHVV